MTWFNFDFIVFIDPINIPIDNRFIVTRALEWVYAAAAILAAIFDLPTTFFCKIGA